MDQGKDTTNPNPNLLLKALILHNIRNNTVYPVDHRVHHLNLNGLVLGRVVI